MQANNSHQKSMIKEIKKTFHLLIRQTFFWWLWKHC